MKREKRKILKCLALGLFGTLSIVPAIGFSVSNNAIVRMEQAQKTGQTLFSNEQVNPGDNTQTPEESIPDNNQGGQPDNIVDDDILNDGYNLIPVGEDTGLSLKVPNFAENKKNAEKIASTYRQNPSDINTDLEVWNSITSIFNILKIDESKWHGVTTSEIKNKPMVMNLSSRNTYINNYINSKDINGNFIKYSKSELTESSQLPAFEKIVDDEENITQNYLNEQGILALQISLTSKNASNGVSTFYVLFSGFGTALSNNSASSNPTLPGTLYVNSVRNVSDQVLLDNIKFESETNLLKSVVPKSRVDNQNEGYISLDAEFNWKIPNVIKFRPGFEGFIKNVSGDVNDALKFKGNNGYTIENKWNKEFRFLGFQPTADISTNEILQVVLGVIGSVFLISLIGYGTVKLNHYIMEKRAI